MTIVEGQRQLAEMEAEPGQVTNILVDRQPSSKSRQGLCTMNNKKTQQIFMTYDEALQQIDLAGLSAAPAPQFSLSL